MRFLFFGDCMFGRDGRGFTANPFRHVAEFVRHADFIFFNLETVISPLPIADSHKEPKVFNYQSTGEQLEKLRGLTQATIFASVANNHSLDYGLQGLEATETFLGQNRILYAKGDQPVTTSFAGM